MLKRLLTIKTRVQVIGVIVACVLLAACNDKAQPLSTSAPLIPPTSTATSTPSLTPTRMPVTRVPRTPEAGSPTWTPPPTHTPAPTHTPLPTITPIPSSAPPDVLETGIEIQPDGTTRLTISEADFSALLVDAPNSPQIDFELDGIWVEFTLHNDFLNEDTHIRAAVDADVSSDGFQLTLVDYESEGAAVTRTQVRDGIASIAAEINAVLTSQFGIDAQTIVWIDYMLASDFLMVDVDIR